MSGRSEQKANLQGRSQVDEAKKILKNLERQIYARESAVRTAIKCSTRALSHYADEVDGDDFDPKLARWALDSAVRGHLSCERLGAGHENILSSLDDLNRVLQELKVSLELL